MDPQERLRDPALLILDLKKATLCAWAGHSKRLKLVRLHRYTGAPVPNHIRRLQVCCQRRITIGAGGGGRTHNPLEGKRILSPPRLPIPPRPLDFKSEASTSSSTSPRALY